MSDARIEKMEQRLGSLEALVLDLIARQPLAPAVPVPAPAREIAPAERPAASLAPRHVVVRVGDRLLGIPLARIEEVVRMAALAPVPGARAALEGLLDLRGAPVEVLDLRVALGLAPLEDDLDARIVIVRARERAFGLKVDEVLEIVASDPATTAPSPVEASGSWLVGVGRARDRLVLYLDLDGVVALVAQGAELAMTPPAEAPPATDAPAAEESRA